MMDESTEAAILIPPDQVRTKPTTNKIATSKTPSKEIKNMMKPTKKPAAPISKPSPGLSTPRVYKPASKPLLCLHHNLCLGPSASDPTSTRKSLILERMGDKYIFKRAFKTFQKSYDFTSCVHDQKQVFKHLNPAKATSIPSLATRQKENGRPTKSSCLEKRSGSSAIRSSSYGLKSNNTTENKQTKGAFQIWCNTCREGTVAEELEAGVIDAKDRRDSLNPKAKPMQSSLPVRTTPKGSSEKVL
ncbi:hypothetical protein F2Q70_00040404 [Brassica cretica]|uniref:Uncharacterized protein n=1 Tax=Brassica cretica TaxID=69181 RepID=A0A8S9K2I0_BRACR|nr:hypothetical protein F2Q70_00040404 [Brassica cretica]